MTLLELLRELDDIVKIIDSYVSGEMKVDDVNQVLSVLTKRIKELSFQSVMFASQLEACLKKIPQDMLLFSGNPDRILGCQSRQSEQVTLHGMNLFCGESKEP